MHSRLAIEMALSDLHELRDKLREEAPRRYPGLLTLMEAADRTLAAVEGQARVAIRLAPSAEGRVARWLREQVSAQREILLVMGVF